MNLSISQEGEFSLIKIEEQRLDAAIAPELKVQVTQLVEEGAQRIILDLSEVTFMDSSSLGALVGLLKMIGSRGDLVIAGATGIVADLFKLTRMDRVFRMANSADEAADQLAVA